MVDLTTSYLGLKLENPLVASSSPLTDKPENASRLEDAGVAALVLPSLFEEQIIHESLKLHDDLERGTESNAEALNYIPEIGRYSVGPEIYLDKLNRVKRSVRIPVLGSLNGVSTGGWVDYAKKIEQAGADALELNLYFLATDPEVSAVEIEDEQVNLVHDICQQVHIPVAVKLSPFYTALPNFSRRLVEAGAKGIVLFNRFYQPDFDLEALEVTPNLQFSTSSELRLPLRWIAIMYGRIQADFALTSGIHTAQDMVKAIMAGASVTMSASYLLQHGPGKAPHLIAEFYDWLEEHEYESVEQMKGSMSQKSVADPATFERANYMKVLSYL